MIKKIISTLFTKGFFALATLAILLISARHLGSAARGQISLLVLNIALVQIVNEIFTGYGLVYFIPRYSLKKMYQYGLIWTSICITGFSCIFLLFFANKFFWHVWPLSFLISLHSFHCVLMLAKEKLKLFNLLTLIQPLILLLALVYLIFAEGWRDANAYILSMYVSAGIAFLLSALAVLRELRQPHPASARPQLGPIIKNGTLNQLGNLAHTLSNRFNYYLIPGASLLGIYSSASTLIESVWLISGSISPLVLSQTANAREDSEKNKSKTVLLLCKLSFLFSLLCAVILLFIPETFFTALLGKDFEGTRPVMLNLAPGILCLSFSMIISHYFSGQGRQDLNLLANSCGLVVTLSTTYSFIASYGLLGACYAASLSYFVTALILSWLFMKRNGLGAGELMSLPCHLLR